MRSRESSLQLPLSPHAEDSGHLNHFLDVERCVETYSTQEVDTSALLAVVAAGDLLPHRNATAHPSSLAVVEEAKEQSLAAVAERVPLAARAAPVAEAVDPHAEPVPALLLHPQDEVLPEVLEFADRSSRLATENVPVSISIAQQALAKL